MKMTYTIENKTKDWKWDRIRKVRQKNENETDAGKWVK